MGATFQADTVPWSGYWWPKRAGGVATGIGYNWSPAPLEKYDLATVGRKDGPATEFGLSRYYDPNALPWEGLCFAVGAASILEKEPVHKGIYGNVTFLVGDKKALLTVAYDGALYNNYRIRTPVDFHGMLEEFISGQKIPILVDLGTDGEIWYYPVFKYQTDYTQTGNTRHYTTTIYYASNAVHPDHVGTVVTSSTYFYYFTLDGMGNIVGTGWEGESVGRAPVRACEIFGTNPRNPGIQYDVVQRIASTDDDPYEDNNSVESAASVSTGAHQLIAIDEDFFRIFMKKGDRLRIGFDSVSPDLYCRSYDPDGALLGQNVMKGVQSIKAEKEGDYILAVIPGHPEEEALYTLYLEHRLPFQGFFPIKPSGSWVTGVSLFDREGNGGRKILSLFSDSGHPRKSYSIPPGGALVGVLEGDFGLSYGEQTYAKVDSDTPLLGLQASMALQTLMLGGNLVPLEDSSGEIFFPHFYDKEGWKTFFGLINTGDHTEEVFRTAYGAGGQVLKTETVTLAPGRRLREETAYMTVLPQGARSMGARTLSGRDSLLGYIEFWSPSIGAKGRALVSLGGVDSSELVIPHVASDKIWWTGAALMNRGSADARVFCQAYDGNGRLLNTAEYLLAPKENLVRYASDLVPGVPAGSMASVRVSSRGGGPLCGLILYGSRDHVRLAGMSMSPPRELPVHLPHMASSNGWWTGIGFVNAGNEAASFSISLLDETQHILAEAHRTLTGNARLAVTMRDLFPNFVAGDARYLKIDSLDETLVNGIYLIGSEDGLRVMGDILR